MLGRKWADRPDVSKLAVIPGFRSCGPKPNPSGNHKKQSRSSGHRPHQRTKKLFHPTTEPNRDRRLVPDSNAPPDISLERFWKRDVHLGGPQEVIKRRIISFLGTIGWFLVHIFRTFFACLKMWPRFSGFTFKESSWFQIHQTPEFPQTLAFWTKLFANRLRRHPIYSQIYNAR